jgi:predicted Zn-dependent peptidase
VYHVTRLKNGLRIATAEMPHMASVSLGIWLGVGARYEPEALNGVCHFIEHLLFKGTRRRSAKRISEEVEGMGGYLNAFTSEETTCFHCRASARFLPELLDVLLDMLKNSRFAADDIFKEREVIKDEIAMYVDEPHHQVQELLNATMWPNHPLGRPITGTAQSLDGITRGDLTGFLAANYVTSNMVIAAAGNVRHAHLLRLVRGHAGAWKPSFAPAYLSIYNTQQRPTVRLHTKKTEQAQIALGIRTCSRHDPRRYALRLLNTILGENMSSRLFQEIREDRGLAYSIYSTPSFFHDTGDLVISAGLDTEELRPTLHLVMRELGRLAQRPPSRAELRRARDYVMGQIDLSLENTENQMNWMGEQLLGYGEVIGPDDIKRRLGSVTASQIRDAARDFFRPERFNLALVSPETSDRGLAELLSGVTQPVRLAAHWSAQHLRNKRLRGKLAGPFDKH